MPPPFFSPDDIVQIHGLERDVESNGCFVSIIRRRKSGKWLCRLHHNDAEVTVNEKNLKRVTRKQPARTAQQPRAAAASLVVPANTTFVTSQGNMRGDATKTKQPCPRCHAMYAPKAGGHVRKHQCRMPCALSLIHI